MHSNEINFPTWTPSTVMDYVRCTILGEPAEHEGLRVRANRAREEGKNYEATDILEQECCLLRLSGVDDDRMSKVFELLKSGGEERIKLFIECAEGARANYVEVRKTITERRKVKEQINSHALELARLLTKDWPLLSGYNPTDGIELKNILFRAKKDISVQAGRNVNIAQNEYARKNQDAKTLLWENQKSRLFEDEDNAEKSSELGDLWQAAPTLVDLIKTLADDFDSHFDNRFGVHEAAINRQKNPQNEYIRAFGMMLGQHALELGTPIVTDFTPDILTAMAIATNVVLNDPNIDVSQQDVKQALEFGDLILDNEGDYVSERDRIIGLLGITEALKNSGS